MAVVSLSTKIKHDKAKVWVLYLVTVMKITLLKVRYNETNKPWNTKESNFLSATKSNLSRRQKQRLSNRMNM